MSAPKRTGYHGTGPGPITPDGCSVQLYERLPVGDEPDIIRAAAPDARTLLELGCGVGRMTRPLIDRGFAVTAVDESPDMLERVRGVRTVRSSIEELRLDEVFDVVLLASFLVHAGDPEVRRGLLRTCRAHVADGGIVLIQREAAGLHDNLPRERERAGGRVRVLSSEEVDPGVHSVHIEYVFPDATWTQTFRSRPMTDELFDRALAEAELTVDTYLDVDRTWARAVPAAAC